MRDLAPSAGKNEQGLGALRDLVPYLWPKHSLELRLRVVLALISLALGKVATVGIPILYKKAIDALTPVAGSGPDRVATLETLLIAAPIAIILGYGLTRVLALGFAEMRDAFFAKVAQRAIRQAALRTFRHLHALSLRFHLDRQTGGLSRAIDRGIHAIDALLDVLLFNIFPTVIELTLVAAVLWALYSPLFACITLATVALYAAWTILITRWRTKFRREMVEKDTEANAKAVDSLLNYETVKYFNNEEHEARRFDRALQVYERAAVKSQTSLSMLNVGQSAIIAGGLIVLMTLAARNVVAGTMTLGDFVLVNSYLLQLYQPLNILGMVYRQVQQALIDMETMFGLMKVDREVADHPGATDLQLTDARIRFEEVRFAYDPRREILRGIDFEIAPGATVAVVGASGAGKSTLSRLLYRFYDVTDGRILIDGQDLRAVTQASLRRAIGIVPQDTVLFNDTIFYNILYGRPDASREEVEEAARIARIHDFILRMPDGYETSVGERGLKLSGGEKQRVAIARVVLKRPRILIFDEATSALDTHTERAIQESLDQVASNHSTLIIAHRLSTVVGADQILVLEDGRIVERGRHASLLLADGPYARLWRRQQDHAERAEAAD